MSADKPAQPGVETVTLTGYGDGGDWVFTYVQMGIDSHRLTFPTIYGQPLTGVYTRSDGHQITLEAAS